MYVNVPEIEMPDIEAEGDAGVSLPEKFVFEVAFKEHRDAVRRSFYPGCRLDGDRTVVLETENFVDVLRAVQFIL